MKREIHRNGAGWKVVASETTIKVYTPQSKVADIILIFGMLMVSSMLFLGARAKHLPYPSQYPVVTIVGIAALGWWLIRNQPTFTVTARSFSANLGRSLSWRSPVADMVIVSDEHHPEVILAHRKTARGAIAWLAESEEDKAVVVRMLRRGIKQQAKFAEHASAGGQMLRGKGFGVSFECMTGDANQQGGVVGLAERDGRRGNGGDCGQHFVTNTGRGVTMKRILMAGMMIGCAGLVGCGRAAPSKAETPPAGAITDNEIQNPAPMQPAVELTKVVRVSPTQHQFRIVAHLPAEGSQDKQLK